MASAAGRRRFVKSSAVRAKTYHCTEPPASGSLAWNSRRRPGSKWSGGSGLIVDGRWRLLYLFPPGPGRLSRVRNRSGFSYQWNHPSTRSMLSPLSIEGNHYWNPYAIQVHGDRRDDRGQTPSSFPRTPEGSHGVHRSAAGGAYDGESAAISRAVCVAGESG